MDQKKWQIVEKFLTKYKNKGYFIGAVLSGSYAAGNENENSDIDIYIIANDTIDWKEKGMKLIEGQLVEYFINPIGYIKKSLKEQQDNKGCLDIRMLSNCKIIMDSNGKIEELVTEAKRLLEKGPNAPDDCTYKKNCYMVWSRFDELDLKYKRNQDIDFNYCIFLQEVINSYFQNKRIYKVGLCKIDFILKDENFKKNYNIGKKIDQKFLDLLLKCLNEKDRDNKYKCAKQLYKYFKKEFSDFDINNYKAIKKI